jgi:hypothetical protein
MSIEIEASSVSPPLFLGHSITDVDLTIESQMRITLLIVLIMLLHEEYRQDAYATLS